ncbi:MAG TPA: hypothetical protein VFT51_01130 [Bacillales bacterium]|nr:hypothetical protein [Bacillales bacterium]
MNLRAVLASLQPVRSTGVRSISLVKGQIFSGKIMKLFPHNRALVQLGGLKIHAQLDAPLVAGRSYWLQVANAKGTPVLKVLQANEGIAEKGNPVSRLLESLGLSSTKSREAVVQSFIDERLPLSKELIVKGSEWLHTTENKQDALDVLKQMGARRLPATHAMFEMLVAERQAPPLHEQLGKLMESLNKVSEKSPEFQQLRKLLPELILKPSMSGAEMRQSLQQGVARLGLSFEHDLGQLQNLPKSGGLETLKSALTQIIHEENPGEVKRHARQVLAQMNSQQVQTLIDVEKLIQPQLLRVLSRFGFSFEADSRLIQTQMMQHQATLKPLLMQVIQQTQSSDVRQQSRQLLAHITSQQLNASGEFQTIIQLPVQSGSHLSEATIKWEGKKQKDGIFDADFCRVLFYLELEHLQETVVDVNIQKRFVGIRIFNESHDLRALIEHFEPILKEQLEDGGYQLSSLKQAQGGAPGSEWANDGTGSLSEVDFRI